MKKAHVTLKVFGLLVLNDLIDTVAQLLMKKGLLVTGMGAATLANLSEFGYKCATSWLVWAGFIIGLLNFFLWIIILYRIDLSVAMPVGSTIYIMVPLLSAVFLHEHVGPVRWLGIFLIVAGIHFVAQSKKEAISQ